MKIPEIPYDTQYDDDTEGNILHELAAHKFTPFFYRKYYMGKNYNEEANQRDFMNNSPLDIASDMKNWTMLRLLIKLNALLKFLVDEMNKNKIHHKSLELI